MVGMTKKERRKMGRRVYLIPKSRRRVMRTVIGWQWPQAKVGQPEGSGDGMTEHRGSEQLSS